MTNKFKKLIGKVKQVVETQTSLLQKKAGTYKVECAIDEEVVDCEAEAFRNDALRHYESHTGIPAPAYLENDPWFGPAPEYTEKQQEYRQQEATERLHQEYREEKKTCESHDIHAKMYQIATKNWTTVAETQGGSENFQEGPDGWNSGTGINQFKR